MGFRAIDGELFYLSTIYLFVVTEFHTLQVNNALDTPASRNYIIMRHAPGVQHDNATTIGE